MRYYNREFGLVVQVAFPHTCPYAVLEHYLGEGWVFWNYTTIHLSPYHAIQGPHDGVYLYPAPGKRIPLQ